MRGEKKKTEVELKEEMQKSLQKAEQRIKHESTKSNVQVAALKHEIKAIQKGMSAEIDDLKTWKLETEERVKTINKFQMPYYISNDQLKHE